MKGVTAAQDHVETQVVDEDTAAAVAKVIMETKEPVKSLEPPATEEPKVLKVRCCFFLLTVKIWEIIQSTD